MKSPQPWVLVKWWLGQPRCQVMVGEGSRDLLIMAKFLTYLAVGTDASQYGSSKYRISSWYLGDLEPSFYRWGDGSTERSSYLFRELFLLWCSTYNSHSLFPTELIIFLPIRAFLEFFILKNVISHPHPDSYARELGVTMGPSPSISSDPSVSTSC